jgi:hypothetical protein
MTIRTKIIRFSSNFFLIELTRPRGAAQRLRRLAEGADEGAAHPL